MIMEQFLCAYTIDFRLDSSPLLNPRLLDHQDLGRGRRRKQAPPPQHTYHSSLLPAPHPTPQQAANPPFPLGTATADHQGSMAGVLGRDLEGALVAVIADEDTITGFLLAGVGDVDIRKKSNFLVVDSKTTLRDVEAAFKDFTSREDIAIVLISQPIAGMIRHVVSTYNKVGAGTGVDELAPVSAPSLAATCCPPLLKVLMMLCWAAQHTQ